MNRQLEAYTNNTGRINEQAVIELLENARVVIPPHPTKTLPV